MGDDLVYTIYGPQRLSRMVKFYRDFARVSNAPGKMFYRRMLREMIARYRADGPMHVEAERLAA